MCKFYVANVARPNIYVHDFKCNYFVYFFHTYMMPYI